VGDGVLVGVGVAVGVDVAVGLDVMVGVGVGGIAVGDGSTVGCGLQAVIKAIPRISRQAPRNRVLFITIEFNDFRIVNTCDKFLRLANALL
jgi:hypothetical protein